MHYSIPLHTKLKQKGRHGDSLDIHWRRWRQSSTSLVNTKAVNLTTFLFLWMLKIQHMKLHQMAARDEVTTRKCFPRTVPLRPRQNGRRFADDTFKCSFLNENVRILIKISLKFVPKGPINNNPALVQIMAWRRSGDKPLSEPMMVCLLTHICVTRPQWVNKGNPPMTDAFALQGASNTELLNNRVYGDLRRHGSHVT